MPERKEAIMSVDTITETRQYLSFKLCGEEFALDISKVREVLDFTKITRVPQTRLHCARGSFPQRSLPERLFAAGAHRLYIMPEPLFYCNGSSEWNQRARRLAQAKGYFFGTSFFLRLNMPLRKLIVLALSFSCSIVF